MSPNLPRPMHAPNSLILKLRALFQLSLSSLLNYAVYQFKWRTGLLRWQTPRHPLDLEIAASIQPLFDPPTAQALKRSLGDQAGLLINEADEILAGRVQLFGGPARPLQLDSAGHNMHWTRYTNSLPNGDDIKALWEMGRFGWATTLARAFQLTGDEKYANAFWHNAEEFFTANPPNIGPHWSSAQEIALRIIALSFSYSVFTHSKSSTAQRKRLMAANLASHAERIPVTLAYARAQNNNHLLSEALGLYTASALMPNYKYSARWRKIGRKNLIAGINAQISADGSYAQHSTNYHRLMLQLALWAQLLTQHLGEPLPAATLESLASVTRWLLTLLDEDSGQLPNLGPNDGAYILPLSTLSFSDFRPVLQAAAQSFLGHQPLPAGHWDEMALWLASTANQSSQPIHKSASPLRVQGKHSWAYLRAAQFHSRPGHADQLHLDLWWRGLNIAKDAGSYLYTSKAPWDNALSHTRAHNTLTINEQDQMTRAGRFLWLDWAQAKVLDRQTNENDDLISITAQHDGYRKMKLTHQRRIQVNAEDTWEVQDKLMGKTSKPIQARLHWLLPDWKWEFAENTLSLQSPHGLILITLQSPGGQPSYSLIRQGEVLLGGAKADPILGWFSPTYGLKEAALSFVIDLHARAPLTLTTNWTLPQK